MSFLMFHSGNIPIIEEDDMKLMELVIDNNANSGFNFVSDSEVTSNIAANFINGSIDGVKLKCLDKAHGDNFLVVIPDVQVNMDVEGVSLYLPNNVLFRNDEGTEKLVRIRCYQNGDREFQTVAV